jgi:hypothetical protein
MARDRRGRGLVIQARILRQEPILFAGNLGDTITCWRNKLGFEQHGIFGEPPEFAIMQYGNAFAMLKQAPKGHAIIPYWKISVGIWNAISGLKMSKHC